jgi:hypothetical protein
LPSLTPHESRVPLTCHTVLRRPFLATPDGRAPGSAGAVHVMAQQTTWQQFCARFQIAGKTDAAALGPSHCVEPNSLDRVSRTFQLWESLNCQRLRLYDLQSRAISPKTPSEDLVWSSNSCRVRAQHSAELFITIHVNFPHHGKRSLSRCKLARNNNRPSPEDPTERRNRVSSSPIVHLTAASETDK